MSAGCHCARSGAELVPGAPGAACLARPSAAESPVFHARIPASLVTPSSGVGSCGPGSPDFVPGPWSRGPDRRRRQSFSPGLRQLGTGGSEPLQRWGGARLSISILSFSTCSSAPAPGSGHLRWPAPENAAKLLYPPIPPRNSILFPHPVRRAWRHSSQPLSLVSSLLWEPAASWLVVLSYFGLLWPY